MMLLIIAACAGVPDHWAPPDWVRNVPPSDDDQRFVLGYGSGDSRRDAREAARRDLLDQLTRILVDRYDTIERGVVDQVARALEEAATERLDDIDPVDTYTVRRPDGVQEWYVLVRYTEDQILDDIASILTVPDEVAVEHELSEDDGVTDDPLFVLRGLLEELPETAREQRERLDRALAIAAGLVITVDPGEIVVPLGTDTGPVINARIREDRGAYRTTGVELSVIEERPVIDGIRDRQVFTAATGEDGLARYRLRAPEVSGVTRIVVQPVWLETTLRPWFSAMDDPVDTRRLETLTARLSAVTTMRVTSGAQRIPTAVILIDRDIAGNPIANRDAARGALQQFRDEGFQVVPVNLSNSVESVLAERSDLTVTDLYDLLPFDILASVERVVIGSAGISRFTEGDGVTVVLDVHARAFDLRRDQRLAETTLEERVTGRDPRATLRSAFNSAGRRVARTLAPRLP